MPYGTTLSDDVFVVGLGDCRFLASLRSPTPAAKLPGTPVAPNEQDVFWGEENSRSLHSAPAALRRDDTVVAGGSFLPELVPEQEQSSE